MFAHSCTCICPRPLGAARSIDAVRKPVPFMALMALMAGILRPPVLVLAATAGGHGQWVAKEPNKQK